MSKIGLLFVLLVSGCCLSCTEKKQGGMVENAFSVAEQQLTAQLKAVPEPVAFPRTIRNGELYTTKMNDWTEGFYPGCLWYIYENNRDETNFVNTLSAVVFPFHERAASDRLYENT